MQVYKIKNIVNNKIYIGITSQKGGFNKRYCAKGTGIERVFNFYNNCKRRGERYNKHLLASIEKYGLESFKVWEEFDRADTYEELMEKEKYYISKYKSNDSRYGYNSTEGGEDGRRSCLPYILRRIEKIKIENKTIENIKSIEEYKRFGFKLWGVEHRVISFLLNGWKVFNCKMCNKYYTQGNGGKAGFCDYCQKYKSEYRKIKRNLKF